MYNWNLKKYMDARRNSPFVIGVTKWVKPNGLARQSFLARPVSLFWLGPSSSLIWWNKIRINLIVLF